MIPGLELIKKIHAGAMLITQVIRLPGTINSSVKDGIPFSIQSTTAPI